MNNLNFLIDGTNFKISSGIYEILSHDCIYFGFIKNNKPNISGFINHLIYHLSEYREDLHNDFLRHNNFNEKLALDIEHNIYNIYLKTFDISNDSKVTIQLRLNKQYIDTFIQIVDNQLSKYNLDFTNYIRTLLLEYAVKPLYQREYFFIYRYSKIILKAQKNSKFITIRTNDEIINIVPVAIEKDYIDNQSYIFGFTKNKEQIVILKFSYIKAITSQDEFLLIDDNDYKLIIDEVVNFFTKLTEGEQ